MTFRPIYTTRTAQPQGAARPSAWARSRELRLLCVGSHAYDAASGRLTAPTIVSGSISTAATPHGIGTTQTAASSFNTPGDLLWRNDWTAAFIGAPSASQHGYAIAQEGADLCAFGVNFDRAFSPTATGDLSVTLLQTGVNRSGAVVTGVANGTYRAFLLRKRGTTISAWVDGAARTVTTGDSFAGSPGASTDTIFRAGYSSNGAIRWADPLVSTVFFGAALSDAECAELAQLGHWYGKLFAPIERRIWIPSPGAPGVPTLSAATVTSITSTTARPRVTVTF